MVLPMLSLDPWCCQPSALNSKTPLQLEALKQAKLESEAAAQNRITKSEQAASAREEKAKAEEKARVHPTSNHKP